jgi:hypothetical protein
MLGVLREERSIGKLPVALGLFKKVDFASSAKGKLTFRRGAAVGSGKESSSIITNELLDIDENVAFENSTSLVLASLDGMTVVVLPDIVDSVKKSVSAQSRASAGGAVDIVVLHGDLIVFANHLEGPVVVTVTASGEGRFAVDEVV